VSSGDTPRRTGSQTEAFFPGVNERATRRNEEFRLLIPPALAQRYMCECGDQDCTATIDLTSDEDRAVRAHPRRLFVLDGHEFGDLEDVVERNGRYIIVEKHPDAME
jgi:hypothetical protein